MYRKAVVGIICRGTLIVIGIVVRLYYNELIGKPYFIHFIKAKIIVVSTGVTQTFILGLI